MRLVNQLNVLIMIYMYSSQAFLSRNFDALCFKQDFGLSATVLLVDGCLRRLGVDKGIQMCSALFNGLLSILSFHRTLPTH